MIHTPIEHVLEVMRKGDLKLYRVYHSGNLIAANEDKSVSVEKATEDLESFLNAQDGTGFVEVALFEKTSKETARGGNIRPVFKFSIKIGTGSANSVSAIQGITSNREKELRDQLEAARQEIRDLQWQKKLDDLEDRYDKKIEGLQDNEPGEWAWLGDMVKPHMPAIVSKLTGQPLSAPTLNDNVSEMANSDEVIDTAVDDLIDIFGSGKVAEVFSNLVLMARADKAKVESFFPFIQP